MPSAISPPAFAPLKDTALFKSWKLGNITLEHKLVQAPLTRMRCVKNGEGINIPSDLMVEYYGQRASKGGLQLTEATDISRYASGYPGVPGVFSDEHLAAWKRVTDAVHAKGGYIFCQLWHTGRASPAGLLNGRTPFSASDIPISGKALDGTEFSATPPKPMTEEEIAEVVTDFGKAAVNAIDAGFDGVEIHGANGYLLDQFLHDNVNVRTDAYGGSIENRCRFPLQVVKSVCEAVGSHRVGIRLSPYNYFQDTKDSDPNSHWTYLCEQLATLPQDHRPVYVHSVEPRFDEVLDEKAKMDALSAYGSGKGVEAEATRKTGHSLVPFRRILSKADIKFFAAGAYTRDNAVPKLEAGDADAIVMGRWFIANPDLPRRLAEGFPLNQYDRGTFYGASSPEKGYTDYPFFPGGAEVAAKKPQLDESDGQDNSGVDAAAPLLSPPLSSGTADNQGPDFMNGNCLDRSPPLIQHQSDSIERNTAMLAQNELLTEMPNFTVDDSLFEDAFNPDTASSFNMPYTTMSNYNWLFDLDTQLNHDFALDTINCDALPPMQIETSSNDIMHFEMLDLPTETKTAEPHAPVALMIDPLQHQLSIPSQPSPTHVSSATGSSHTSSTPSTKATSPLPKGLEKPMSLLNANTKLPRIDAVARSHILQLVESVRPVTPTGDYVTTDHTFLALPALQTYSDLFFTRFNATYPLIHLSSFEPAKVDTLLLLSVLLLGATYCEKDAHQIAVCIHDVLRPQIFAHASFSAVPELWMLQTILLVECFGKSRAGQKQHDMSHLFHGLLINLIRRSDCQTAKPETSLEVNGDLEDEWKAWADAEQKKRLALLCFMWDTQHAVLFCQSLCMSSFELRCTLPCNQSLWEAESAESWQKLRKTQTPPILYLTALKTHIGAQAPIVTHKLNALSRVLILHGLMSIAWDMNRRDQTSLGVVGNDVLDGWKHRIAATYDSWKADFDTYVMSVTQTLSQSSASMTPAEQQEARRGFAMFSTANSALYHAAYVVLFSDFLDIQIYAGARHLLGRPVRREDYTRSQRVVKRWANEQTQYAAKAAWHAGHIVKDAVMNLEGFDAGGLFIHPWCLYLATVTVWSYHHARPGGKQSRGSEDDEDEMIWDAQADMNALIGGMTSGTAEQLASSLASNRKASTAGLTAVISKQLSKVRWAVVRDGMLVLKGLVPWRLINDAEG
ncbi:FMN-linked oxidoreductase, partial [Aureobasidium melanogenum]